MCLFSSNFAQDQQSAQTRAMPSTFNSQVLYCSSPLTDHRSRGPLGEMKGSHLLETKRRPEGRGGEGFGAMRERTGVEGAQSDGGDPGQGHARRIRGSPRVAAPVAPSKRGRRGLPAPNEVGDACVRGRGLLTTSGRHGVCCQPRRLAARRGRFLRQSCFTLRGVLSCPPAPSWDFGGRPPGSATCGPAAPPPLPGVPGGGRSLRGPISFAGQRGAVRPASQGFPPRREPNRRGKLPAETLVHAAASLQGVRRVAPATVALANCSGSKQFLGNPHSDCGGGEQDKRLTSSK